MMKNFTLSNTETTNINVVVHECDCEDWTYTTIKDGYFIPDPIKGKEVLRQVGLSGFAGLVKEESRRRIAAGYRGRFITVQEDGSYELYFDEIDKLVDRYGENFEHITRVVKGEWVAQTGNDAPDSIDDEICDHYVHEDEELRYTHNVDGYIVPTSDAMRHILRDPHGEITKATREELRIEFEKGGRGKFVTAGENSYILHPDEIVKCMVEDGIESTLMTIKGEFVLHTNNKPPKNFDLNVLDVAKQFVNSL